MIKLTIQKIDTEIEEYSYEVRNGSAGEILNELSLISDDQSKIDYASHLCDEGVLELAHTNLEFLVKSESELS